MWRLVFAAALTTTTVREQHPRSQHKGATSMQTHPAVRVGFELATDCIQFYVLPTRTRHPYMLYYIVTVYYLLCNILCYKLRSDLYYVLYYV